ncbi:MAG: DUF1015 domain-containing protein, partial [Bacteroidetes bacterium]|nr:DUF1015 domain-containing protein [Bacteroidota bacterium]
MITINAFKGLRPRKDNVHLVAAKPYDVLNSAEAKEEVKENPISFLRISKPEINFDNGIDQYADEVYAKGNEIFNQFIQDGILIKDETPCLYIYAQTMNGRTQTGLVAGSSIDDYFNDVIKKHELTLVAKENDRIRHMKTKMAQPGMVFLTYRSVAEIDALIDNYTQNHNVEYDFVDSQDVRHQLWVVNDAIIIEQLKNLFETKVPFSYIADGHHRSAASAKVGKQLREENPNFKGTESFNYFLSCLFPSEQLQIQDYNRLVKDTNGLSTAVLLEKIQENFDIEKIGSVIFKPSQLHEFSLYIDGNWYKLTAKENTYANANAIEVLDVSILSNYLLAPILNIQDQRTDKRIDFVGGIRGLGELQKRVDSGEMKLAFAFYPVSINQLMEVADSNQIMPPKSTWFEP